MTYKSIYIWLVSLLVLSSCQKEGLTDYDQSLRYLYIPTIEDANLATLSFQHHLGVEDYEIQFPVKLVGQQLTEDQTYLIEVVNDEKLTTAKPEDYTLLKEQVFHAGVFEDVVKLTLHKTDNLKDEKVLSLTIRLVPNENFDVGHYMGDPLHKWTNESLTASVTFNDKISRPDWWNDRITKRFLGTYSDNKYRYFIESTGVSDLTDFSFTELRTLSLQFKADLVKHPEWKEEDGSPIIVVVN